MSQVGFSGRSPGRVIVRPGMLPALRRKEVSKREWHKDRIILDLNRTVPPGCECVPGEMLRIDRGLFLAWNLIQCRWEVWCRREEERRPPYFVTRVAYHPEPTYDRRGVVVAACPGRPLRSRTSTSCPPSCAGVYMRPDHRILPGLRIASAHISNAVRHLEEREEAKEEALERRLTNDIEAITRDNYKQLLGIKHVGYRA